MWLDLANRFQKLHEYFGNDKSCSFHLSVRFDLYHGPTATLGTYDISDWPRTLILEAKTELELFNKVQLVVHNAERIKETGDKTIQPLTDHNVGVWRV